MQKLHKSKKDSPHLSTSPHPKRLHSTLQLQAKVKQEMWGRWRWERRSWVKRKKNKYRENKITRERYLLKCHNQVILALSNLVVK